MATELQINANKLNALKSTGPRTSDGKINSSQNAVRHGLTAQNVLIPGESPEEYNDFRDDIIEEFKPVGHTEAILLERLVGLLWRLRRVPALEAALYAWNGLRQIELDERQPDDHTQRSRRTLTPLQPRIGRIFELMGDRLNKLDRHEAHLMNQMCRTQSHILQLAEKRQAAALSLQDFKETPSSSEEGNGASQAAALEILPHPNSNE